MKTTRHYEEKIKQMGFGTPNERVNKYQKVFLNQGVIHIIDGVERSIAGEENKGIIEEIMSALNEIDPIGIAYTPSEYYFEAVDLAVNLKGRQTREDLKFLFEKIITWWFSEEFLCETEKINVFVEKLCKINTLKYKK